MNSLNVNFSIIDNNTNLSVSSAYALSINTLNFIPNFNSIPNTIQVESVKWDFGDNTYSTDLTASHYYTIQGIYNINLTVTDTNGNVYNNTYIPQVTIYDFVDNKLDVANYNQLYTTPITILVDYYSPIFLSVEELFTIAGTYNERIYYTGSKNNYILWDSSNQEWLLCNSLVPIVSNIYFYGAADVITPNLVPTWTAGALGFISGQRPFLFSTLLSGYSIIEGIKEKIIINRYNSWQYYQKEYTIIPYASGSLDPNINLTKYFSNQWSHLDLYSVFYELVNSQYLVVSSFNTIDTNLYAFFDSNTITYCNSSTPNSIFVGTSGYVDTYFSTDTSTINTFYLFYSLDTNNFFQDFKDINTFPIYLPIFQVKVNDPSSVYYSLNGITNDVNFNIPVINWQNTPIPFIASLQDLSGNNIKNLPLLSSNNINQTSNSFYYTMNNALVDSNNTLIPNVSFYTENEPSTNQILGGYFKGYFISPISCINCFLSSVTIIASSQGDILLETQSNKFNIYPKTGYNYFAKINEDFDATLNYLNLRLQESLIDKNNFFNNFLGTIVGNVSSDNNSLGKVIYEKIANFTDNNSNIDKANIDNLVSLCRQFSIPFNNNNLYFPPNLKRLIDLLSINFTKLKGVNNQYRENFNKVDPISLSRNINLGNSVSIFTDTFSLSDKIVAYERYSGTYKVVQTALLTDYQLTDILPFSAFSQDWGWELVLPPNLSGIDIRFYYDFYRYVNKSNSTIYDNTINWNDILTTTPYNSVTYTQWTQDDGIMDQLINYELTKSLNLFQQ